ncbi:hypothetical protein BDV12DRAFT_201108 [Aspergillus spectabilis]
MSHLRSTFEKVKIDEEGEFVCRCGFRMKDYLVKKEKSPYYGLKFYACAKFIVDPSRCETKIWFDEKESVRALIPPAMRSPRTPRKQVDIRIFGHYTPPASLKRKAETQSFDSGVGDLGDNEPPSPPPSRSAKRTRCNDEETQAGVSAARPIKPFPKRRLFDDILAAPKPNPAAEIDPFAPRTLDSSSTASPSVTQPIARRFRRSPSQTEEPVRASKSIRIRSSTPPTSEHRQILQPSMAEAKTPTKGSQKPDRHAAPSLYDSDSETYGWDDDWCENILEVADSVENPRLSPLFV